MAFFRRSDPKPDIVVDETSYNAWKKDPGGGAGWLASLTNELASSKSGYTSQEATPAQNRTAKAAGDRYVLETAMDLESSRPTGRGRRSVQPDGHGHGRVPLFSRGGIWRARTPNMDGRVDYGRWPETTMTPRWAPVQNNYGAPASHRVDSRPGRDGCPGCPQC